MLPPPLVLLALLPALATALVVPPPPTVLKRQDPIDPTDPTTVPSTTEPTTDPTTPTIDDSDPCVALIKGSLIPDGDLFPTKLVHAYYSAVPFQETVRQNVLEVISKLYDLDVLEFDQLNAPDPIAQQVDIRKELARVNTTTYASDFALQMDLYKTFLKLNDGHHAWTNCYQTAFGSLIPVPVVGLAGTVDASGGGGKKTTRRDDGGGAVKYYVAPDVMSVLTSFERFGLQTLYTSMGIDLSLYAGKEIARIDGMAVADFVDFVANNEGGLYQDQNQRRNDALASYSFIGATFARKLGNIAQPPFSDRTNITFAFADSSLKDLSIDYVSRTGTVVGFTSTTDFFEKNCRPKQPDRTAAEAARIRHPLALYPDRPHGGGKKQSLIGRQAGEDPSSPSCAAPQTPLVPLQSAPQNSTQFVGGRLPQFYILDQGTVPSGTVGVMFLPSFSPDSGCIDQFISDMQGGVKAFRDSKVTRLIVDVTGNGGGSVALALILENIFSGSTHQAELGFQSVMREASLSKKFIQAHIKNTSLAEGSFQPDSFRTPDGLAPLSATTDVFASDDSLTINGQTMPVSQPLLDTPQGLENLTDSFFSPDNVIIYSNGGSCGSSCASFTLFAQEFGGHSHVVSTVSPSNETIEFQSFAAGQVLHASDIYAELALTGLTDDVDAPPPLVIQAELGFAFRATFGRDTRTFNQYISRPANATFALTQAMYEIPIEAWNFVAKAVWSKADSSASSLTSGGGLTVFKSGQPLELGDGGAGGGVNGTAAAEGGSGSGSKKKGGAGRVVTGAVRASWAAMVLGLAVGLASSV